MDGEGEMTFTFQVLGHPAPKGSVAFTRGNYARHDSPRLGAWTAAVKSSALELGTQCPWFETGPVRVAIVFLLPMGVTWKTKRKVAMHHAFHAQSPDIDKLFRSTLDAMTGVCFVDDSQVAEIEGTKRWAPAEEAGAHITVTGLLDGSQGLIPR
jgi:crossover junction endodeoxyribonuclease RusA